MTKIIIIAAGATLASAALAAAPAAAQQAAPPSGPRVELIAGYEIADDEGGDNLVFNIERHSFLYGVGAGYDVPLGAVSIGADVEITRASTDEKIVIGDGVNVFQGTIENKRDLYVGGRLTVPVGKALSLYGKAGYTDRKDSIELDGAADSPLFGDLGDYHRKGYRLGAGARASISGNLYAGGEYRYSNYDEDRENVHQLVATVGVGF